MNKPILVVSDIHGSLSGANLVMEARKIHDPAYVLCLGDVLYHGPRNDLPQDYAPKKVIEIMNSISHEIVAVRGNCDAEVDQMVLRFPLTADYNILHEFGQFIFATHGHVYAKDHLPDLPNNAVFLQGHTHVFEAYEASGILILNPGSVSLPKQGNPKTYGLLDKSGFQVFDEQHNFCLRKDYL